MRSLRACSISDTIHLLKEKIGKNVLFSNSFLLLLVGHSLLEAMHLFLVAYCVIPTFGPFFNKLDLLRSLPQSIGTLKGRKHVSFRRQDLLAAGKAARPQTAIC